MPIRELGGAPIYSLVPIFQSTHYDHLAKRSNPYRLTVRACRDATLQPKIRGVVEENRQRDGVRKASSQLRREGFGIAGCTIARLIKAMCIHGIMRDKANRQFRIPATNWKWVSYFTYIVIGRGFAFIINAYAHKIVDWQVSATTDARFFCCLGIDGSRQAADERDIPSSSQLQGIAKSGPLIK